MELLTLPALGILFIVARVFYENHIEHKNLVNELRNHRYQKELSNSE